jgi:hypothetical protein
MIADAEAVSVMVEILRSLPPLLLLLPPPPPPLLLPLLLLLPLPPLPPPLLADIVLRELPIGGFIVKLSHRRLLDGLMEICGVPQV